MEALVNFTSISHHCILHYSRIIQSRYFHHEETTSLKEGVGNDLPYVIQSILGSEFPKQNVELVTPTETYWVAVKIGT